MELSYNVSIITEDPFGVQRGSRVLCDGRRFVGLTWANERANRTYTKTGYLKNDNNRLSLLAGMGVQSVLIGYA